MIAHKFLKIFLDPQSIKSFPQNTQITIYNYKYLYFNVYMDKKTFASTENIRKFR